MMMMIMIFNSKAFCNRKEHFPIWTSWIGHIAFLIRFSSYKNKINVYLLVMFYAHYYFQSVTFISLNNNIPAYVNVWNAMSFTWVSTNEFNRLFCIKGDKHMHGRFKITEDKFSLLFHGFKWKKPCMFSVHFYSSFSFSPFKTNAMNAFNNVYTPAMMHVLNIKYFLYAKQL